MSSPASPDGRAGLLNPRRSAHATIHGYLYQACLGVLRWLELRPQEILLCEGDEDLDRFLLGRGAVSEQVKAYSGGLSLSDRAVLESLGNFLRSYVTLRRDRGETRSFVFTTTAQQKKRKTARGIDFDLLAAWQAGKRTKKVLTGVRKILQPRNSDKDGHKTTEAIAWLDGEPDGWKGFLDAVEWSFDAPNLASVLQGLKVRLAELDETASLPAETFVERLISHVLRVSSQKDPSDRQLDRKALSDLAEAARKDLQTWERTPAAQRLRAVFDELAEIGRLLHDNTATLPAKTAPGKLLTADYEVIPFDPEGRLEELAILTKWCQDERGQSVLLITGEGGAGKTRLLIEWCRHLRHQGWYAGFVRPDRKAENLDPLLEGVTPRLIVVDYAETRLEVVEPLLLKIGLTVESGFGPKLRLVLLARQAGEWWTNLSHKGREVEDLLAGSLDPLPITPSVPDDPEERRRVFQAAVDGFSRQTGRKPPRGFQIPDLMRKDFEQVLYLHMAALAALQGERIESADSALEHTLRHERHYWDQEVSDLGLNGMWTSLIQKALACAVAAVTMVGGARTLQHAQTILRRSSSVLALDDFHLATLLTLLRRLYTGSESEGRYLESLQPDLLGEELIAEILSTLVDFLPGSLEGIDPLEGYAALTVLTRLAQRRPSFTDWIGVALKSQLATLALPALDVAIERGDPVGRQLAAILEKSEATDVIFQVQALCDKEKFKNAAPLREVAYITTQRKIQQLRERSSELDEAEQVELAMLSNHLGNRLRDLGRREEALEAVRESVMTYRLLAQRRPDVFQPELAGSLSNLGNRLRDLGKLEEALAVAHETIRIQRLLAQEGPDALQLDLAGSLNNLGNRLSDLGRKEEALEAASEAVKIYQNLKSTRPDSFRPNLARSLNNLGIRLSQLGRREEALEVTREAVQIRRLVAQQRPNASKPSLAKSLDNLGIMLSQLGRHEEAFEVTNEAVQLWRLLVQHRPDAFWLDLAGSLDKLGNTLRQLGKNEEALQAYEEGVQVLSTFFIRLPEAYGAWMTEMIRNYISTANVLGREPDETLIAPIQEILDSTSKESSAE